MPRQLWLRCPLPGALSVALALAVLACGNDDGAADAPERVAGPGTRLYIWAGERRTAEPGNDDLLIVADVEETSGTFGEILDVVKVGSTGNEPHHTRLCGSTFWAGGLLSGAVFRFDLSDPDAPTVTEHDIPDNLCVTDDFLCIGKGHVLSTLMGDAHGGTPGGIVELDADGRIVGTYPADDKGAPLETGVVDGVDLREVTGERFWRTFNPHGIDVHKELDVMLTTDMMEAASLAPNSAGEVNLVVRNTVRVWDFAERRVVQTVPVGAAPMEVRFIPGPEGRALVTCMASGELWLLERAADGRYFGEPVLDFDGDLTNKAHPGTLEITGNGRFVTIALAGEGEVRRYDITDPRSPVLDDTVLLGRGSHYLIHSADESRFAVADYFLQEMELAGMGEGDDAVWLVDATSFERRLLFDFAAHESAAIADYGIIQPHGMTFY